MDDREKLEIEKIAAGMRRMAIGPHYLIYLHTTDVGSVMYREEICGVPVLHAFGHQGPYDDALIEGCPWVPAWRGGENRPATSLLTRQFCDVYEDYVDPSKGNGGYRR